MNVDPFPTPNRSRNEIALHVVPRQSMAFCNIWSKQVFDKQQHTDNYVCYSSANVQRSFVSSMLVLAPTQEIKVNEEKNVKGERTN